jgi:hypothetical protein
VMGPMCMHHLAPRAIQLRYRRFWQNTWDMLRPLNVWCQQENQSSKDLILECGNKLGTNEGRYRYRQPQLPIGSQVVFQASSGSMGASIEALPAELPGKEAS